MAEENKCEVCGSLESDHNELFLCERCECTMCSDCQAPYNTFSQIDYNCCSNCYTERS